MRQNAISRIEEIARKVAETNGLEIVEVELKGTGRNQMVRIYIDKPEGVTHSDCELISHLVGEAIDPTDIFPGHYTLEVSSPGVERKLKKWKDFERFQGKRMKVVMREPFEGVKHYEGILQAAQEGSLTLDLAPGKIVQLPFEKVDRANLKFDW